MKVRKINLIIREFKLLRVSVTRNTKKKKCAKSFWSVPAVPVWKIKKKQITKIQWEYDLDSILIVRKWFLFLHTDNNIPIAIVTYHISHMFVFYFFASLSFFFFLNPFIRSLIKFSNGTRWKFSSLCFLVGPKPSGKMNLKNEKQERIMEPRIVVKWFSRRKDKK